MSQLYLPIIIKCDR